MTSRFTRVALTLGGLTAAGMLALPATAAADPVVVTPMTTPGCNWALVDYTLHLKAPALAAVLDSVPEGKQLISLYMDSILEQRKGELGQYLNNTPQVDQTLEKKGEDPQVLRDKLNSLGNGCTG